MVCGLVEALITGCDISNNSTLIIELGISISLAVGLPIYFFTKGKRDMKNQQNLIKKQSEQMTNLGQLVEHQAKMLNAQNASIVKNTEYVKNEILEFLKQIQKTINYFMQHVNEKTTNEIQEKLKIDPNNAIDPMLKRLNFSSETGLSLPDGKDFKKYLDLLESASNLLPQNIIVELKQLLPKLHEYFQFDKHGNLPLTSDMRLKILDLNTRKLNQMISDLSKL